MNLGALNHEINRLNGREVVRRSQKQIQLRPQPRPRRNVRPSRPPDKQPRR